MYCLLCCRTDFCLSENHLFRPSDYVLFYSSNQGEANKLLLPSLFPLISEVSIISSLQSEEVSLFGQSQSPSFRPAEGSLCSPAQPRGPGPRGLPSSWPSARFPGDWDSGLVGFRCLCFTLTPLCSFPESEAPLGLFLVTSWESLGGFRHCGEVERVRSEVSFPS